MTRALVQEFAALRPGGGFGLIMADPPWRFENFSAKGEGRNATAHYDCTPLDWIKGLPVSALAADNCLLWLWATNPMLRDAFDVLDAWGFTYTTAGSWNKRTIHGKSAFGTGYVLRSSNEPFLIGKIGKPRATRRVRSVIPTYERVDLLAGDWPASSITIEAVAREHSRKPDEAFAAAEALLPDVQRIELFSRQARPGWHVWGNQTDKFASAGTV
ncbi:MT-A70 family methyltransferase [Maritimibacter alexandrii]|uniref:MT-A70 family methyltransferase n=1 Tax=Maritimibacter alexandrii TaxID=2570355 RepID=UPI001F33E191|nr:MT-A70 family methyltransferase [Maritimibacter alexandrii]